MSFDLNPGRSLEAVCHRLLKIEKHMFSYQPFLVQYVNDSSFRNPIRGQLGDIRQPWIDLGSSCGTSEFEAKALFALGLMRRYLLSANEILGGLRHQGFPFAYVMCSSSIELLGRCIHPTDEYRQHSEQYSTHRIKEGLQYIRDPASRLPQSIILSTNYFDYSDTDLVNLRHLAVHGACISAPNRIKADVELLHEFRRLIFGTPAGESDALGRQGPIEGAIDRYFNQLNSGDTSKCDRISSAAISPLHFLRLHDGNWPFAEQLTNEIRNEIDRNISVGLPPISGGHHKQADNFDLS